MLDEQGFINLDFDDITAIIKDSGVAFVTGHTVKGSCSEEREYELGKKNLLPEGVSATAKSCLFCLSGCTDIGLDEVEATAVQVRQQLHPDALMVFGALFDDYLVNEMKIIVMVAGLDV